MTVFTTLSPETKQLFVTEYIDRILNRTLMGKTIRKRSENINTH